MRILVCCITCGSSFFLLCSLLSLIVVYYARDCSCTCTAVHVGSPNTPESHTHHCHHHVHAGLCPTLVGGGQNRPPLYHSDHHCISLTTIADSALSCPNSTGLSVSLSVENGRCSDEPTCFFAKHLAGVGVLLLVVDFTHA